MTSSTDPSVLLAVEGGRGTITLNRPSAMNALTLPMIRAIRGALAAFERDPAVRFVTIDSAREGVFCAGGDIRGIREARLAGRHDAADDFFAEEFALNLAIARCAKPYIALIDGICMGGGVGLAVHGTHRVVSDRLVMAMPETAIGYFPDVGASFFLNALPPGQVGLCIALTGERLTAADALYCGLATACVPLDQWPDLRARLADGAPGHEAEAIARLSIGLPPGPIALNRSTIDHCFGADSLEQIVSRLADDGGAFADAALAKLRAASPASLRITFDLLRSARGRLLAECLQIELALAKDVTRDADFAEGVRAMLVDKDRQPRWSSDALAPKSC
jgi:enoyl-CoA hydratase